MMTRLVEILDRTFDSMLSSNNSGTVAQLALDLGKVYDLVQGPDREPDFSSICRNHPLREIILSDPYSRRAFEKPRGYAGNAVMLDYI